MPISPNSKRDVPFVDLSSSSCISEVFPSIIVVCASQAETFFYFLDTFISQGSNGATMSYY